MNRMYVYEGQFVVVIMWETFLPEYGLGKSWSKRVYRHPDTEIFVKRAPTVKSGNWERLDNAVMNALQDAGLSVEALERISHPQNKKRPKEAVGVIQPLLFED